MPFSVHMLLSSRQTSFVLFAALLVSCWVFFRPLYLSPTREPASASVFPTIPPHPEESAGNETLGILALSHSESWRTRGLVAAARLTGLQITIPPQPPTHPDLINAFARLGPHEQEKDHPTPGGSRAWLAHLDLIKFAYQSNFQTTLIIEDDVDWDVSVRTQMKNIASAVRSLTKTAQDERWPYGCGWDVLWIGHCGEYWEEGFETVLFEDDTVCPHANYSGWAHQYLSRLPDGKRAIYWSNNPVCSFAYALSHDGARKVLGLTGAGQGEAFDIKMMGECKAGNLRCISVAPEVIHQYFPPEEYRLKSLVDIGNGEAPGPEDAVFESTKGTTENILHSARCQALWADTCLK
ncbi:uncharacterized protein N7487_001099 [Penicillium crustosum]|uniref:uncharacterized protein n=1 Tax=Penicillium crustosum TaxID=36656 RepID=UPI00238ADFF2|nr:uncharacterized protein N7487_001099 [Penicillium crustosum]KAJ5417549.1 hypothetical protein N7487_001099 [Penicillium crustosum]